MQPRKAPPFPSQFRVWQNFSFCCLITHMAMGQDEMQRPILVWRRPGRNGPSSRLIILHSIALLCWLYYRFCRPELSTVPRELVVRLHVQKNSIAQHDTTQHSTNAVPGSPIPSSSSVLPFRRRPISLPRPTLDGDSNPWRWAKSHQTTLSGLVRGGGSLLDHS